LLIEAIMILKKLLESSEEGYITSLSMIMGS